MTTDDDNVASFAEAHDKKHGPDPEHVYRDDHGVKWFEFTCAFRADDKEYSFRIWAFDFADAERRLKLLRETATVSGQLYSTIPG